jgi:hypothetical protein
MHSLSIRLGFWSALVVLVLALAYLGAAVTGVAVATSFPPFVWTDLPGFLASTNRAVLVCFTFNQVVMFLISPAYLVLLCSLQDYAPAEKKVLTRIALYFWTAPMILANTLYFLHFHSLRLIFWKGITTGLEHLVQWNPDSAVNSIGTLGWTFFAGLAFVFLAPIFSGGRLERGLRMAFLVEGVGCLLGAVGALLQNMALVALYMASITLAGIVSAALATILFKRLARTAAEAGAQILRA